MKHLLKWMQIFKDQKTITSTEILRKRKSVAIKTEGKFSCILPLRCVTRYMGFENVKCIYLNVKVEVDAAWLIVASDAGMARFRFR